MPSLQSTPSIHSIYNPQREAERYVNSLNLNSDYSYLVLIECGFGYVIPFLRKKLPSAKIISLHLSETYLFAHNPVNENKPDAEWRPESGIELDQFLEREMEDVESCKVKIIEWRAALAINPKKYLEIMRQTVNFVKYLDANKRTEIYFSKVWARNENKNIKIAKACWENTGFAKSGLTGLFAPDNQMSLVIAGSAPNLERQTGLIKNIKAAENCMVLALSSAVAALQVRGLMPDMVITTDGGEWAKMHMQPLVRGGEDSGMPFKKPLVIAGLNAAAPSFLSDFPCVFFSDGSSNQNKLLKNAGIPLFILPQRGTSAASAIDFGLRWTSGKIYIAGIEFEGEDIKFHARPYMLDLFLSRDECRLKPFYSVQYKRTKELEQGASYKLYKEWFKRQNYPERLLSISGGKYRI